MTGGGLAPSTRARPHWLWVAAVLAGLLAACSTEAGDPSWTLAPVATPRPVYALTAAPTATAVIVAGFVGSAPTPTAVWHGDKGIRATLGDYAAATGADPTGAKTRAYITLQDFINPQGMYGGAWWFEDDGKADIYEALAVILYTEGHTNFDVRTAVAARYLWYCGGTGTSCQGAPLVNFFSYFQPWREPWVAPGFTSRNAMRYEEFAGDVIEQRPGLLTAVIPGADQYTHSADGLSLAGPIDWGLTPFHFANVHPTWDSYLRETLRRLPNGSHRLWVLTMTEAAKVCTSRFICPDMTQPRP